MAESHSRVRRGVQKLLEQVDAQQPLSEEALLLSQQLAEFSSVNEEHCNALDATAAACRDFFAKFDACFAGDAPIKRPRKSPARPPEAEQGATASGGTSSASGQRKRQRPAGVPAAQGEGLGSPEPHRPRPSQQID